MRFWKDVNLHVSPLELTHSCTPVVSLCWFVLEAVVVTHPPEEIRRALASSHNTITLLLLLLLHYVVTHIMGIAFVVFGSVAIKFLDQRLHSHADAQVGRFLETYLLFAC